MLTWSILGALEDTSNSWVHFHDKVFFLSICSALLCIASLIKSWNSSEFKVYALKITNNVNHTNIAKPPFIWRIFNIIDRQIIIPVALIYNKASNFFSSKTFNIWNLADLDFIWREYLHKQVLASKKVWASTFFLPMHISDKKTSPHSRWLMRYKFLSVTRVRYISPFDLAITPTVFRLTDAKSITEFKISYKSN